MNTKHVVVSAGLSTAFLLGSLVWYAAGGQDAAKGGRPVQLAGAIGVVDMDRVYQQFPKAKKMHDDRQAARDKVRAEIERAAKEIDELRARVDTLDPNTPQAVEVQAKMKGSISHLQEFERLEVLRMQKRELDDRVELYEDINKEIERVAKTNGVQLVLRWRGVPEKAKTETQFQVHDARDVLYFDPALDLTEMVIRMLRKLDQSANPGKPANGGK